MQKERIQIKHDTPENWAKAERFTPLAGELIIYDGVLENGVYVEFPKIKMGDGVHKLSELPFLNFSSTPEHKSKVEDGVLELKI